MTEGLSEMPHFAGMPSGRGVKNGKKINHVLCERSFNLLSLVSDNQTITIMVSGEIPPPKFHGNYVTNQAEIYSFQFNLIRNFLQ